MREPDEAMARLLMSARDAALWAMVLLVAALATGGAVEGSETDDDPLAAREFFGRPALAPRFELHGFANIDAIADRVTPDTGATRSSSAFALGELDLYIVSQLTDSLSFLGETVFELNDDGETQVDVERLILKYTKSDRFWVSFGRHHNKLGYWNNTYHHGLYLQPTVERPLVLKFEDDGGVLPIHTVGLAAGGKLFRGAWALDYNGTLSNGRGLTPEHVQGGTDLNNHKAVALQVSLVRDRKSYWSFGPSVYHDRIPPDPATPGRDTSIKETIVGGHLVYRDSRIEFLAEYYDLRHDDEASGAIFQHSGYYALAIWRPWMLKPYVGVDRVDVNTDDLFFSNLEGDVLRYLVGMRIDPQPYFAVKVELRREDRVQEKANVVAAQLAFSF
jgi:hypothetical protein